jgi:hypothetical protein
MKTIYFQDTMTLNITINDAQHTVNWYNDTLNYNTQYNNNKHRDIPVKVTPSKNVSQNKDYQLECHFTERRVFLLFC